MHEDVPVSMQPALFYDGWRVQMPAPTKSIRMPSAGGRTRGLTPKQHVGPVAVARDVDHALHFESEADFPALG